MRGCVAGCASCERLRLTLRELLSQRTWPELTEDLLAHTAGISRPALSAHYPSVAACAADALDEAVSDLGAACAAARTAAFPAAGGFAGRFLAVTDAARHWLADRPAMARMLFVVPEQARDPVLLGKMNSCKHVLAALFEDPAAFSPAGSTHVEFMVGLFFHATRQHLLAAHNPDALRDQLRALASFTRTAHRPPPTSCTGE